MRVVTISRASCSGVAPPARPVPLPRVTNGMPSRVAVVTASATSSVDSGKHTAPARPVAVPASRR